MVLINNLTIDEINAALLHLQRSQGEIVGGTKGNTINNISVTQQGGGGYTPDFSSAIKNLEKRVDTLDVKTEQNQQNIAGQSKINVTQKDQISDLYNLVNNLRSSQITELFFDEDTRVLTLATTDARYDVPLPSEEVSLTFDSTSNKLVFSMGEQTKEVTLPYINVNQIGVANGVAELDATGRVPYSQLPESAMEFKGEWNADTNTPELKDGHGTNGDFYICNVGGTANFGTSQNPRTITFYVNDRVIYQGNVAQWKRLPASEVRTVNGQSGDVTLNGTNVNYSNASDSPTLKDKIDTVEGYAKTQSDWGQTNTSAIDFIKNKPSLATVATSGSYNDLSNKPTIPAAQIQSDWTQTDSTKKDFIKNKIPIWITSGSADDNMSPIDSVTDGSMRPVTSNAVADIMSNLPTDAVLHYSFDDVPDYPDGSSLSYYNKNFVASDFTVINGTITVSNGILKVQNTSGVGSNITKSNWTYSTFVGKILKIKIYIHDVTEDNTTILRIYSGTTLNDVYIEKDKWVEISLIVNSDSVSATVPAYIGARFLGGESTENYFMIESLYIGDGSYNTPIIDNANGQWNSLAQSGVAVQGISGKAYKTFTSQYINTGKSLTEDFAISIWINPDNDTSGNTGNIMTNNQIIIRNGATWSNNLMIYVMGADGNWDINYTPISSALPPNVWTHFVITKNGNSVKVYLNGVLLRSLTMSQGLYKNGTNLALGDTNNTRPQSYDDLLIFDRALSETEVQALYLNKANTPKYYSWADWKLPQV